MLSYDLALSIARDAEEVKVAAGLVARCCAQEGDPGTNTSFILSWCKAGREPLGCE